MRRDDWRIEWALSAVNVALTYAAYLASCVAGALWLAWGLTLAEFDKLKEGINV